MRILKTLSLALFCFCASVVAQDRYELNEGWKMMPSADVKQSGQDISKLSYPITSWKKATVPGTVLTSLLNNGDVPDPFYGMNNNEIKDVYETGREYYTYWFVKDFKEKVPKGDAQIWLTFRGINYSCDIYLNGQKVNKELFEGMHLRKTFNITNLLSQDGENRLAVIVYPPNNVGNPNGGQGGDGRIAKDLTHQYAAGWDWIQPIRDRNTGIWDKVYIEKSGSVRLRNSHIVTKVPGKRNPKGEQEDAILQVSTELSNTSNKAISGVVSYEVDGQKVSKEVTLPANQTTEVSLPDYNLKNPKLWWPANYGPQNLYKTTVSFTPSNNKLASDSENVEFGVREIQTYWNDHTKSKEIAVNGQKIFIKGGNWIISDAMLRFDDDRYDAEIRYHRDMNLNLIRIWGGAITERPEFYEACDKYGILVIQDFWFSGDCNGRWEDPLKADDQWTRRKYPDNHPLVLTAAEDMIKMIRNYPSLAIWCGGNEIMPPDDILIPLRDSILPKLDGTRWFVEYSNSDDWSFNSLGGNGDGPYTIQPKTVFWNDKTWPFNSEVGSVGVGDYESLVRFLPPKSLVAPQYNPKAKFDEDVDDVWTYHTYSGVGYKNQILPYGAPKDIKDFAMKAQLVNYDQYRALMEGFSSHMWDWYTGTIIWKTQNPWTSMRGQMYDYYLDPNAGLFGTRKGSELLHVMCNIENGDIFIVNNTFEQQRNLMLVVKAYDIDGKETGISKVLSYMEPSTVKKILNIEGMMNKLFSEDGGFLALEIQDVDQQVLSTNVYWVPNKDNIYTGLDKMKHIDVVMDAKRISDDQIEVSISNSQNNPVAFFSRLSLIDNKTGERILPAFYDDNYVTILPGQTIQIKVDYKPKKDESLALTLKGWNVKETKVKL